MAVLDDESLPVIWTNKEAYRAQSEKFESDVRMRYGTLIQQLRERGFLTPAEFDAVSTPKMNIVVEDQRTNKTPLD
jgi:hypothetical protein